MTIILTPTFTPATTTVAFADMVPDISAFLQGCPSLVIERTARKIVTDLCQRGKVWSMDAVPVALVAGTYEYPVAPTQAYADAIGVSNVYVTRTDGTKVELPYVEYQRFRTANPKWPDADDGEPRTFSIASLGSVLLAPVPEVTATLNARVYVRPTPTALVWDESLYNEFHRVVFHGVLHELMLMPGRTWSDSKTSMYHGKQWTYLMTEARDRALRGFNTDDQAVQMRPFA